MLNVLHRTTHDPVAFDQTTQTMPERGSPPSRTPPVDRRPPSSWPFGAKLLIVILAVLALAGAVGTVVGWTSDDEPATTDGSGASVAQLQATIDDLTAERDGLRADIGAADEQIATIEASLATVEAERDDALTRLTALEDTNQALDNERLTAEARVTELEATLADVTEARDELVAELADANQARDLVATELAEANAVIAELENDLTVQKAFTATAVDQRDALAALFPLALDATLEQADLAGDYDVDISRVYCEGFSNCGTLPSFDELTIVETSNGWLRVEIDGYLDAGLFRVDGALFAVAESTTAVPACSGVARRATLTLTLYAHGLTVDDDGGYVIDDLGASLLVQAPSVGSCARGLGVYGLELTPTG